ncbi:helicase conserved Cterminal domain containing protein [Acanthamoeba castellanii str. Neff]|uniref:Helicase conserved Cterminal domain containing protein n=1 Tax=Acanthamoeba castellanii (strain ATCC 30010 / Neff) TaxID=1257118 RepID=L8GG81_ACACF|nr:helicase conserved Cterminal domain containing protein [Acanthamoeba castellanii str. Neff]ELR11743.1 helicase conserved Cterminal domain containing protein [Acanthamoeba castellanii str. Neff]
MVICSLAYKPLVLLYLLEMFDFKRTLCFTSSVESTHRLYLLLTLMGQTGVAEYSSTLPQRKRTQIIEKFAKGDIKIVIASDAMSRGLDIEDVENVINYDVPPFIKTYVHRVGRTARAGRQGKTYTLLLKSEAHHFRSMLKKAEHSTKINQVNIDYETELNKYMEQYQEALEKLKEILKPHMGKNDPTQRERPKTAEAEAKPAAQPQQQKKQKKQHEDKMEEVEAMVDDLDDEDKLLDLLKQSAARSWGL